LFLKSGKMGIRLTADEIRNFLRLKEPVHSLAGSGNAREAAVLVPLIEDHGIWHVLFTRRSNTVNDHKGQVSFPGGAIEPDDANTVAAALREAEEEIGIKPSQVQVLGELPPHESVTGFRIYPVIAKIEWPILLQINPDEVSRVFTIPLEWLARKENYEIREWRSPFGLREGVIFYKPYDGEQLWGISARIMQDLLITIGLLTSSRTG